MTQEKKQAKTDVIVLKEHKGFTGDFPWRASTMRDELTIAAERVRLSPDTPVDDLPQMERRLNHALASMRVLSEPLPGHGDTRPNWWHESNGGLDLHSMGPISEYWVAGVTLDDRFHSADTDQPGASKTAERPEDTGGAGSDPEETVESPVQPPTQRSKTLVTHGQGAD